MYTYENYKKIFSETLEVDISKVEGMKYKDDGWDSVGHMSLITMLEEEYKIELETEDIVSFSSFDEGIAILKKYGINVRNETSDGNNG